MRDHHTVGHHRRLGHGQPNRKVLRRGLVLRHKEQLAAARHMGLSAAHRKVHAAARHMGHAAAHHRDQTGDRKKVGHRRDLAADDRIAEEQMAPEECQHCLLS